MRSGKSSEFIEEMVYQNNKYICIAIKLPVYISNKVKGILALVKIQNKISFDTISSHLTISKRELQCLYYLIRGYSLKQIAHVLKISSRTAGHHIDSAKNKLNCYHRSDLIEKASQLADMKDKLFLDAVNQLPVIKSS